MDILLLDLRGLRTEEEKRFYVHPLATSITDQLHNYENVTDTIYCPIILEDIPFDKSIVATCCWNAFEENIFKQLNSKQCPICQNELTHCYVTVIDNYFSFSYSKKIYFKLGVNLNWTVNQLIQKIQTKTNYTVGKIYKDRYRIYNSHYDQTLSSFSIGNGTRITVGI